MFVQNITGGGKELRNLFLYASAKTVSVFGTAIYNFALSFYVLKLTGSAFSFALTLMLGTIPMIAIMPFAGVIADKVNKKKLVVWMDVANGVLLLAVYAISMMYGLTLPLIYAAAFLLTVFTTFFGIGIEAGKPSIVSDGRLMNINSISKIIDSVSSILGPVLGGIVFAVFDINIFILINALSFFVSGLAILFIDFNFNKKESPVMDAKIHFGRDIKEGFQYMYRRKSILGLFYILISLNFFSSFAITIPLPYIINTILELGSKSFGIIQAAFPAGMILGALVVKRVTNGVAYPVLLKILCVSLSICMMAAGFPVLYEAAAFGQLFYGIYYSAAMFIFGLIVAFIDIPLAYFMQKEIPEEYRGRVMSIGISIGKTMVPLAMIGSGLLLGMVPPYVLPIGGGIVFLAVNFISSKKMDFTLSMEPDRG